MLVPAPMWKIQEAEALLAWSTLYMFAMKRILIVHNLLEGQKIVHELSDKDFAIELVEGDGVDEHDELAIESKLFFKLD